MKSKKKEIMDKIESIIYSYGKPFCAADIIKAFFGDDKTISKVEWDNVKVYTSEKIRTLIDRGKVEFLREEESKRSSPLKKKVYTVLV